MVTSLKSITTLVATNCVAYKVKSTMHEVLSLSCMFLRMSKLLLTELGRLSSRDTLGTLTIVVEGIVLGISVETLFIAYRMASSYEITWW